MPAGFFLCHNDSGAGNILPEDRNHAFHSPSQADIPFVYPRGDVQKLHHDAASRGIHSTAIRK
jgi:hypothetical protein